jgi:hypothetical protein
MYGGTPAGVVRSPFNAPSQMPKGRGAGHAAEGLIEFQRCLRRGVSARGVIS